MPINRTKTPDPFDDDSIMIPITLGEIRQAQEKVKKEAYTQGWHRGFDEAWAAMEARKRLVNTKIEEGG